MMFDNIHKQLKEVRGEYDISQEEMSEVLGVTRMTYVQIEGGRREMKVSELARLAEWSINSGLKGKKETVTKGQMYKYLTEVATPKFTDEEFYGVWKFIKNLK